MHPQVFLHDTLSPITMRIHLAEREGWALPRPAYINYACSKAGSVVQFEDERRGYTFACHFLLKRLRKADFEGNCPLLLADFAQALGASAEAPLVEALTHARGME